MHRCAAFPELNCVTLRCAVACAIPGKVRIQLGTDGKAFFPLNQLPELLIGAIVIRQLQSGALPRNTARNLNNLMIYGIFKIIIIIAAAVHRKRASVVAVQRH